MQVIVCGAGQVGLTIARHLAAEGNDVTVIDRNAALIQKIGETDDLRAVTGYASHPDVLLDFNRCIMCSLCVTASRDVDKKNVFAMGGRGILGRKVHINSESGKLGDTDFAVTDRAAHICPVGVILPKRKGFAVPIGERQYDKSPISAQVKETA